MIGEILADEMLKQDSVESLLVESDCLLPTPLHAFRHISRGYNQAEVIARRITRKRKIETVVAVKRLRNTETQTHLHTRATRMKNLKGAFALIDPDALAGKRVVVVDDVFTTGATLQTLAREIRKARPKSLSALVVAVAEKRQAPLQSSD